MSSLSVSQANMIVFHLNAPTAWNDPFTRSTGRGWLSEEGMCVTGCQEEREKWNPFKIDLFKYLLLFTFRYHASNLIHWIYRNLLFSICMHARIIHVLEITDYQSKYLITQRSLLLLARDNDWQYALTVSFLLYRLFKRRKKTAICPAPKKKIDTM